MSIKFQTVQMRKPNRGDHVWAYCKKLCRFKCVLCGAITKSVPPPSPTPPEWMPESFEELTDEERAMCPNR